ncbi:hypothetical protein VTK73DRAFT_1147 [Phialemonium thermophilum]|uniref:Actin-like ATPase domain-containing protein n=1 Tax=Phialemonium thermophilum TaxID=223376 RepID=A0ABR3XB98_9PEZI
MAANPPSTSLAHRTLSSIRAGGSASPSGPSSPHTPLRSIHSTFASPSSLRAEEDVVVIEFGTRCLRVGFSGDAAPRAYVSFGPEQQRRVGDFRVWRLDYVDDWRKRSAGEDWGRDHELWSLDVRNLDLGLVGDKIERALREAFTKYLLIDSKPRRMIAVLPSLLPTPLLSAVLDTLFNRFSPPIISLLSNPLATSIAAGVRSALVVDLGWNETLVTSVYEYREVRCHRTVRAGRMLVEQMDRLIGRSLARLREVHYDDDPGQPQKYSISFEEAEDITSRLAWCKPAQAPRLSEEKRGGEGLPTVREQDESEAPHGSHGVSIPLASSHPPTTLELSFLQLAEPCEATFFDLQCADASFDDHELPLHLLVYRSLLQLPLDVRAVCMPRIIFTGGGTKVLGLRRRIFDEVVRLREERGWDPVVGKAAEQLRHNAKFNSRATRQAASDGPTPVTSPTPSSEPPGGGSRGWEQDGVWHEGSSTTPEADPIEEQLRRGRDAKVGPQGDLRAIETVGAWSGASLLAQLKIPAVATIDRELWLQQGAAGAARPSEVDFKVQQRQSMGAGGLMRNATTNTNWTLGIWGSI